jgi:adenylate kinase family enzyme
MFLVWSATLPRRITRTRSTSEKPESGALAAGANRFGKTRDWPDTVSVRRISVVGNSGSGKTTLARALATELGVPHLELDSIHHLPNWQPLDRTVFRNQVDKFIQAPGWVVDGNYSAVRDLVWSRADTVIWLDLPRRRVMRQVIWRTLRRMATKAELWNGNRERWRNLLGPRDESIIV